MDAEHRVLIPASLRSLNYVDFSQPVAICFEEEKIFYLRNTSNIEKGDMILDVVKVETEKGRIKMPTHILKRYAIADDADPFIFAEDKKYYLDFLE